MLTKRKLITISYLKQPKLLLSIKPKNVGQLAIRICLLEQMFKLFYY